MHLEKIDTFQEDCLCFSFHFSMEYFPLLFTATLIHLLALMSPGPDFLMAIKNSLSYSRKTGIWTAVGFAFGISVHIFYCVAGFALLISQSILLFNTLKLLGAAYLIFIGVKAFFSKSSRIEISAEKKNDISPFRAIKIGFLTNVLNPKVTLFFLSLFTLVVPANISIGIIIIMGIVMAIDTFLWFSLVAIFFTQSRIRSIFDRFQGVFQRLFGGLLVLLGIKVALAQR